MPRIYNAPPQIPTWPWGGPRTVREKLVDPAQFDRKRKAKKSGDPKNPALASSELLEFMGPGHTSEELRLPLPPFPGGHDADLEGFTDRPQLEAVAARSNPELLQQIERNLKRVSASPERVARLEALLARESQMLNLVGRLNDEVQEIQRRIREEQKAEGF